MSYNVNRISGSTFELTLNEGKCSTSWVVDMSDMSCRTYGTAGGKRYWSKTQHVGSYDDWQLRSKFSAIAANFPDAVMPPEEAWYNEEAVEA